MPGAPSLVLSLWKVEDRSTAALMEAFYRALAAGAGKAAALRRAQHPVLHNDVAGGSDYSAPYFWAPFHLIGHSGPLATYRRIRIRIHATNGSIIPSHKEHKEVD